MCQQVNERSLKEWYWQNCFAKNALYFGFRQVIWPGPLTFTENIYKLSMSEGSIFIIDMQRLVTLNTKKKVRKKHVFRELAKFAHAPFTSRKKYRKAQQ